MNAQFLQDFFKQRMVELFHRGTLDSYSVRTHNVMSIIDELRGVLHSWIAGNIKHFETIEYCLDECITLLKNDKCLTYNFYNKDLFLAEFKKENDLFSQKTKDVPNIASTKRLLHILDRCFQENNDTYLSQLFANIESKILVEREIEESKFMEELLDLDALLISFATELLRVGYSKFFLFGIFDAINKNEKGVTYSEMFANMKSLLEDRTLQENVVIFKLHFRDEKSSERASKVISNLFEKLPEEYSSKISLNKKYQQSNPYIRYYVCKREALDWGASAVSVSDELHMILDAHQNIVINVELESKALILTPSVGGGYTEHISYIYPLNRGRGADNDEKLSKIVDTISKDMMIKEDVKNRVKSALRYLRIGDNQVEIEQRFINYWIALEFIFSSPSGSPSSFERMKKELIGIMVCLYAKRNILNLQKWVKELNFSDFMKQGQTEQDKFVNSRRSVLLKYRIRKMKSKFVHTDKTKAYLDNHRKIMEQNLSRIYRLRNELVHEASISHQDITNITANLRYYLVLTLNQMLSFYSKVHDNNEDLTMSHFFWFYDMYLEMIKHDYDIDVIMNVPITDNILY